MFQRSPLRRCIFNLCFSKQCLKPGCFGENNIVFPPGQSCFFSSNGYKRKYMLHLYLVCFHMNLPGEYQTLKLQLKQALTRIVPPPLTAIKKHLHLPPVLCVFTLLTRQLYDICHQYSSDLHCGVCSPMSDIVITFVILLTCFVANFCSSTLTITILLVVQLKGSLVSQPKSFPFL